jgi:preprotein translocase subunit YajC
MYLLLIRPQRKRMREQADLQKAVGVGDEVVTTSGVFGFITGEDGPQRFWLEIDENVQIRISRAAVQQKVDTSAEDEQATDDDEPVGELEPADEHDDAADEVEDESAEHTDES